MKFNSAGLAKAGLDLLPPFAVEVRLDPTLDGAGQQADAVLLEHEADLTFSSVARVLPGRRVSGIAHLDNGETFFAKIFYGKGARRYWQRELQGAARLQRAAVKRAPVLGVGACRDGAGYVVLFRVLPEARNLTEHEQPAVLAAVDILAGLHDVNCVQTDVHFNNFVLSGGEVHAVDADGVRPAHLLRQHFANLAMLLAQRPPWYDSDVGEIWSRYAAVRGEYVAKMGSAEQLAQLTQLQRAHRVRRYLNKTQRECSEFVHKHGWRRNWLCDRRYWPALQRFMLFPEMYMGEGTPLKLGNSSTVVRVDIDGRRFVVKRYNIKGLTHRVRRWFKRRARHAWCNGHWLAFLGVPTAKPVALLECKWGWLVGVCYLVMPDTGERNLGQELAAEPCGGKVFDNLAPQAVEILQHLQAAQMQHGDLKASNFVIHDGVLSLIDYDAVRTGGIRADVERFLRNWQDQPKLLAAWRQRLSDGGLLPDHSGQG